MTKGLVFGVVLAVGVVGCGRGPVGVSGRDGAAGAQGVAGLDGAQGLDGSAGGACEVSSDHGGKNIMITCPNTSVTFKVTCPGNGCKERE